MLVHQRVNHPVITILMVVFHGVEPRFKNGDSNGIYPLVNVYNLLLKMAIEIVRFPIKNGDFP